MTTMRIIATIGVLLVPVWVVGFVGTAVGLKSWSASECLAPKWVGLFAAMFIVGIVLEFLTLLVAALHLIWWSR